MRSSLAAHAPCKWWCAPSSQTILSSKHHFIIIIYLFIYLLLLWISFDGTINCFLSSSSITATTSNDTNSTTDSQNTQQNIQQIETTATTKLANNIFVPAIPATTTPATTATTTDSNETNNDIYEKTQVDAEQPKNHHLDKVALKEENFDKQKCAKDEFSCETTAPTTTTATTKSIDCIPLIWLCDNVPDCPDGSDERQPRRQFDSQIFSKISSDHFGKISNFDCASTRCDARHHFRCPRSGECIPRGWLCDSQPDCGPIKSNLTGDEDHHHPHPHQQDESNIADIVADESLEPIRSVEAILDDADERDNQWCERITSWRIVPAASTYNNYNNNNDNNNNTTENKIENVENYRNIKSKKDSLRLLYYDRFRLRQITEWIDPGRSHHTYSLDDPNQKQEILFIISSGNFDAQICWYGMFSIVSNNKTTPTESNIFDNNSNEENSDDPSDHLSAAIVCESLKSDMMISTAESSTNSSSSSIKLSEKQQTPYHFRLPAYIASHQIAQIVSDANELRNWFLLDREAELIYSCGGGPGFRNESEKNLACTVVDDYRRLSRPLAIELDAAESILFVAQHGARRPNFGVINGAARGPSGPAILRRSCGLGGPDKSWQILADVRIVQPTMLALDRAARRIYWIDYYLDLLESIDYDGANRRSINLDFAGNSLASIRWTKTQSMLAYDGQLYLAIDHERNSQHIRSGKFSKKSSTQITTMLLMIDIEARTYEIEPIEDADADDNNNNNNNNRNITERKVALLWNSLPYSKSNDIVNNNNNNHNNNERIKSSDSNRPDAEFIYSRGEPGLIVGGGVTREFPAPTPAPITHARCPTQFDLDLAQNRIYYIDDCAHRLFVHHYPMLSREFVPHQIESFRLQPNFDLPAHVESLAMDWCTQNIYLLGRESVQVINLDLHRRFISTKLSAQKMKARKSVIRGLVQAKALALDPRFGLMFFAQYGSGSSMMIDDSEVDQIAGKTMDSNYASIFRARMDGTEQQTLIRGGAKFRFPNSLTLDSAARQLYWCDSFYRRIERVDYDGSRRMLVFESRRIGAANSISFHAATRSLYWTELQHGTLQRLSGLSTDTSTHNFQSSSNKSISVEIIRHETAPLYRVLVLNRLEANMYANFCLNNEKNITNNNNNNNSSGECEHFRLRIPAGYVCACADGFEPEEGGKCSPRNESYTQVVHKT